MSKLDALVPKYLFAQVAVEVLVGRNVRGGVRPGDALLASLKILHTGTEYSYRGTLDSCDDSAFVLRLTSESLDARPLELVTCALHNQLGMTFITVVSEFAALLPWAQRLLEHPNLTEDYSDMAKALQRVRNSYNDYRDQCIMHATGAQGNQSSNIVNASFAWQLLYDNQVQATAEVHPEMPTVLASGIDFGLYVIHAFQVFDAYFQQKCKTPSTRTK